MPELTALHLATLALLFAVGVGLGWLLRSDRCAREKIAINAGWQEQSEARQAENDRLAEQNQTLMQQIVEHETSGKDSAARSKDLSASLKEVLQQRDEFQRRLKDLRGSLDGAVEERDRLQKELDERETRLAAGTLALKEKDNKIFKLSRQLSTWQTRVPPLVERFRQRDREARALQSELDRAINRIAELEAMAQPDETRIEAFDRDSLERLYASNEQYGERDEHQFGVTGARDEAPDHQGDPIPPDAKDDLQRIKGVGPTIEKTLNELGIYRFEQVALISEHDIDRIDTQLRGIKNRIYREDWIGQARSLHQGENSGAD
ncbi:MAG TPA: hypothetical protein VE175_03725 [Woeseiaceae bacterium]|jgi:predicted flap endonuclease-1-like 5' DNA nuclease|nr:hypothetical protein [Woeseiaceae bacterium]